MPITKLLEGLRKEQKTRKSSCTPCDIAINDLSIHFKDIINHMEIVRDMHMTRTFVKKMPNDIVYTIEDIEAKINTDKCWIEENINRYRQCCKEGKLPEIEKFKC